MPPKNNWLIKGVLFLLLTFFIGAITTTGTFLWGQVEKKVDKVQYEKDLAAWQRRLDEAVSRIEKSGLSLEARASKMEEVMIKLLLELRGPAR